MSKKSSIIPVPENGFEIRRSDNEHLEIDKPGWHYYIVLLESLTAVLIVILGSMKDEYEPRINDGSMTKITNTINPYKISKNTNKRYETIVRDRIKKVSNDIPYVRIGNTNPSDTEKILERLLNNPKQRRTSRKNRYKVRIFKQNRDDNKKGSKR